MSSRSEQILSEKELALQVIRKVILLNSQEKATALIESLFESDKPVVLSFINAHAFNLCCENAFFSSTLLKSDVIFRDGIGMHILYKSIGIDPGANLNGTDCIPELINRFKGKKLALLGTKSRYLKRAADKLLSEGHTIVLTATGYLPFACYLEQVTIAQPEIIIIGMGMPKQENLSIRLREVLHERCLIINGGAIIDFWGNRMPRAPLWVRRLRMEWFFRLLQEPRRLYARYIFGNFVFLNRTRVLKKNFRKPDYSSIYS